MSRSLAAKASLAARVDALGEGDETTAEMGLNHRAKLETRLKHLEEGNLRKISGSAKAKAKFEKYQSKKEVLQYPDGADITIAPKRKLQEDKKPLIEDITPSTSDSPPKKKKKIKSEDDAQENVDMPVGAEEGDTSITKKKKKKKKAPEGAEVEEVEAPPKKVKVEVEEPEQPTSEKKKKKKKKKSV